MSGSGSGMGLSLGCSSLLCSFTQGLQLTAMVCVHCARVSPCRGQRGVAQTLGLPPTESEARLRCTWPILVISPQPSDVAWYGSAVLYGHTDGSRDGRRGGHRAWGRGLVAGMWAGTGRKWQRGGAGRQERRGRAAVGEHRVGGTPSSPESQHESAAVDWAARMANTHITQGTTCSRYKRMCARGTLPQA